MLSKVMGIQEGGPLFGSGEYLDDASGTKLARLNHVL
jgi:hypothetical protein